MCLLKSMMVLAMSVIIIGCGEEAETPNISEGDVEFDFIDITEGSVIINDSAIVCMITLRYIPEQLSFNNPRLDLNYLEYAWGVEFDTNKDGSADYDLSLNHYYFGGPQKMGDILSNTQKNLWKKTDGSWSSLSAIDASIEGNTIVLSVEKLKSPDLANITDESKVTPLIINN